MATDPKKDPTRRCRPIQAWPTPDRCAWGIAMARGDILEPCGGGADWAHLSRRKMGRVTGVGSLGWKRTACSTPKPPRRPASRRNECRTTSSSSGKNSMHPIPCRTCTGTVSSDASDGTRTRLGMAPSDRGDGAARRDLGPQQAAAGVPSETLLSYGIELMTTVDHPANGSRLKRACRHRDGLMIALLAARPLRRRNFTRIEIGQNLVRQEDDFWLRFEGGETKTGEPIETPAPAGLVQHLARYLSHYRPFLLLRGVNKSCPSMQPNPALWISVHGAAMTEIGIYFAISQLTKKRFGYVVNPHLFRDSAATSIAIEDPEHVHIVRSVLGHSTLQSGERHYIHARTLEASRRYQQRILELRRQHPIPVDR